MMARHEACWHTCRKKTTAWGFAPTLKPHEPEARVTASTLAALRELIPRGVVAFVNWDDPARRRQILADGTEHDHRHRGAALARRRKKEASNGGQ